MLFNSMTYNSMEYTKYYVMEFGIFKDQMTPWFFHVHYSYTISFHCFALLLPFAIHKIVTFMLMKFNAVIMLCLIPYSMEIPQEESLIFINYYRQFIVILLSV